jgi:hypothetical protein
MNEQLVSRPFAGALRQQTPAVEGVRSHHFMVLVLGERFECDLTWMARWPGVRWTVVANGDGKHKSGFIRTGISLPTTADGIEQHLERDASAGVLAEVILSEERRGGSSCAVTPRRPGLQEGVGTLNGATDAAIDLADE